MSWREAGEIAGYLTAVNIPTILCFVAAYLLASSFVSVILVLAGIYMFMTIDPEKLREKNEKEHKRDN